LKFYLDSSLIVAALLREARTPDVRSWLRAQGDGRLSISPWVNTEVSSALALKVRTNALPLAARAAALAAFGVLASEQLGTVAVNQADFASAARFVDRTDSNLRAGDALHVAIAARTGLIVATLDRLQAAGAHLVGVQTVLL